MEEIKITKVNASFSLKKSLGSYEMADIFFAAEAEVRDNEAPEEVAQKAHDFCKKLAVEKYNSFSRNELISKPPLKVSPEEEYSKKPDIIPLEGNEVTPNGVFPKVYRAKDRNGTKELVDKKENTLEPQ